MRFLATWQGMALLSAFFAALTAILGKVGVAGLSSNLATFVRTVVIVVFVAVLLTVRGEWTWPAKTELRPLVFLVLSGLATGASWLCYWRALQLGPASSVAPIDKLSVALTMLLAFVVLRETVSWQAILGGGLVVAGVLVIATAPVPPAA